MYFLSGMGDPDAFENPAVLTLSLLFYRYHNEIADEIRGKNQNLSSDEVFDLSRRWVIGALQVR